MFKDLKNSSGEISQWNEAMFKMRRLDQEQMIINSARHNPLGNDLMPGRMNYEVWFSSLCNLYAEGRPKYAEGERESMDKFVDSLRKLLKLCYPFKMKSIISLGKTIYQKIADESKWDKLNEALTKFENEIRRLNDEHGLSTLNVENMDGHSILR